MNTVRLAFLSVLLGLTACDSALYLKARMHENSGRIIKAVEAYETFAENNPEDPKTCDALIRAGRIYAGKLERCLEARRLFERAVRGHQDQAACIEAAKTGVMTCPDYFPLDEGRSWTYGDTASGGKNMRLEWDFKSEVSSVSGSVETALYAGERKITGGRVHYERKDWAIWETSGTERNPILRYPFVAGNIWEGSRGGRELEYKIMDSDAEVETVAGRFAHCIKVREFDPQFPESWKYQYYAPFVGLVKTTIAGPDFEKPNTELISYTSRTRSSGSGGK